MIFMSDNLQVLRGDIKILTMQIDDIFKQLLLSLHDINAM